jgi:uncharacterized membrane protein
MRVERQRGPGPGRQPLWRTLVHGLPGHPLHPPFTDAVIGMFTLAAGLSVIGYAGAIEDAAGKGAWLAMIGGLIAALGAAATGFADWVTMTWGSERWRAATWHLTAMISAVTLFAVAAWLQYDGYKHGDVTTGGLVFALAGFAVLTVGGWLGGSVVFVHGMRVLDGTREEPSDGRELEETPDGGSRHGEIDTEQGGRR